ncbi:rhamnogalacturonan endolyase YesW [Paenibacillus montaniterrae]|uniref:Rhamnogalacturonan endolyase YesW n=2 Tax=Paenibacillus montaniterrae TaxID=429341 RepID=A0A919YPE7_9BACL|nr:rhamnogalacturonan endolyase YesW [Paenibacillus montaniterrae]
MNTKRLPNVSRLFLICLAVIMVLALIPVQQSAYANTPRQMEALDRGVVAVQVNNGIFVSWRLLGTDPSSIAFNVYRNGTKVNSSPIATSTNYVDSGGLSSSVYTVRPIVNGVEGAASPQVTVWGQNYLTVPLQRPAGGTTPSGESYTYSPNDASVGDLDGDGKYEIVLKWDPSNAKDNAHDGYTGPVIIDAYRLDGTRLWRINLGRNIRAGAHYTQFLVYDFDGDGKAEVVMKTADGTVDGTGVVIGNANADYRNSQGRILSGPEFLTVFDGLSGRALSTINYEPARGTVSSWGDNYGNRSDRFLAGVAYLDGQRPSIIMARGYYAKTMVVAYNWRNNQLTKLWTFDSTSSGNGAYAGQGNHSLSIGDVDGDSRDEIVYGAMVLDDNGRGLYSTGLGHGDALHLGDFNPNRAGLEVFGVHESTSSAYGAELHDARTGQILWGVHTGADTGRGLAADIDPRYPGAEMWASNGVGVRSATGQLITSSTPSINFAIYWDGDLLRELLDHTGGTGKIDKWNYNNSSMTRLLTATGAVSINGTKGNPSLQADILGDWREEVIWPTADSTALRIYTTTALTNHRIYTLMHDPIYRLSVAWQNVAYNQPPHTGFFLGDGMAPPPQPNIYVVAPPSSSNTVRLQSHNFTDRYIRHIEFRVQIDANVSPAQDAQFRIVSGLAGSSGISFESVNYPGHYLRVRANGEVWLDQNDNSSSFANDATFRRVAGLANSSKSSYQMWTDSSRYLRHYDYLMYAQSGSGSTFNADATFAEVTP